MSHFAFKALLVEGRPHNSLELSGRGNPDRYLFYQLTSYNFVIKSRSIPGPFQREIV
jgi:hypothetical protein